MKAKKSGEPTNEIKFWVFMKTLNSISKKKDVIKSDNVPRIKLCIALS